MVGIYFMGLIKIFFNYLLGKKGGTHSQLIVKKHLSECYKMSPNYK